MCGETEGLMLLFWSALFVGDVCVCLCVCLCVCVCVWGGGGEVGKVGGSWFNFRLEDTGWVQDFILWFLSSGKMGSRFSCMAAGMETLSLDLPWAIKNIVGHKSVGICIQKVF